MFWKIGCGSGKNHRLSYQDRGRQTIRRKGFRAPEGQRGRGAAVRHGVKEPLTPPPLPCAARTETSLLPPVRRPEVSYLQKQNVSTEKSHILTFGGFPVKPLALGPMTEKQNPPVKKASLVPMELAVCCLMLPP